MKRAGIILAVGIGLVVVGYWLSRSGPSPVVDADNAYQRGDYVSAVYEYQKAASECAEVSALAANQGAALYRLERYDDADARYQVAESGGDDLRAARAAFDRGNCAL